MDMMIDQDLLQIATYHLSSSSHEVREQAATLLSSFAISRRARENFGYAFPRLQELLEDKVLAVRVAVAKVFTRLSINDDGCQRIVESESAAAMVRSFVAHSRDEKHLAREDGQYLEHLLEAFANLTFSDYGIAPLLGSGAVPNFNRIISQEYVGKILAPRFRQKIQALSLRVLGNISINHDGKQECIDDKVILHAWKYLESDVYEERLNASLVLMSCTVHLNGKQQAIQFQEPKGQPKIVQVMVERLLEGGFPDLRKNLKVALTNIAELPEGFLLVAHELSDKTELLDEVFGPRAVKALHNLLPKLSDHADPLKLDAELVSGRYAKYVKSLAHIIKKYKEDAAQVAIDETINFSEKLAPFINPETQLQFETVLCLREVCSLDQYNCHILRNFLEKYGDNIIRWSYGITTLNKELIQYPDLVNLARSAQIFR